jgi:3-phosphoglycerate kinase
MEKLTVRDVDVAGRKVLVRVDFNVPIEDGKVKDDSRIRASIPTIAYLLEHGATVILMSHLGRPNGKVVESARLRPVAERLTALLRRHVPVTGDALGIGTQDAIGRLKSGQILMLENLRFHAAEEANDPAFAKALAAYGEIYVNDAFGTAHRAHASTVGVPSLLPAYAGLLMESEIRNLSALLESPERPFAAVVGGAKVSGKIGVLEHLMDRVDTYVIGGGMANTFLVAKGHTVGKSLLERDRVDDARRILELAESKGVEILLPTDVVVAKEVTRGAEHKIVPAHKIPNSWSVVDIGPQTIAAFEAALEPARTVFWNGPLGVFEVPTFGDGTRAMARYLARRAENGAAVVVGGGDSVAALEELKLTSKMTHISTGGGASLEFLEGRELPGIAVLQDRPVETKPETKTARGRSIAVKPDVKEPVRR